MLFLCIFCARLAPEQTPEGCPECSMNSSCSAHHSGAPRSHPRNKASRAPAPFGLRPQRCGRPHAAEDFSSCIPLPRGRASSSNPRRSLSEVVAQAHHSPALRGFCTPTPYTLGGPRQPGARCRLPSSQARLPRVALLIQGHREYPRWGTHMNILIYFYIYI